MSCTFWNRRREKARRVKEENRANSNSEEKEIKVKRGTGRKRGDK